MRRWAREQSQRSRACHTLAQVSPECALRCVQVRYLQKLVDFLKRRMTVDEVVQESPTAFLHKLDNEEEDFSKPMKFVSDRLRSLLRTLEVTDVQDFSPIMLIADFATLVSTFQKGFGIIIEPYDERTPQLRDPLFQLCCNDASIAIKPVFERFQSVVVTSGTLSPLDMCAHASSVHLARTWHAPGTHLACICACICSCLRPCLCSFVWAYTILSLKPILHPVLLAQVQEDSLGGASCCTVISDVLCARRHTPARRDARCRPGHAVLQV